MTEKGYSKHRLSLAARSNLRRQAIRFSGFFKSADESRRLLGSMRNGITYILGASLLHVGMAVIELPGFAGRRRKSGSLSGESKGEKQQASTRIIAPIRLEKSWS